jgi:hypothetical protein
MHTYLLGSLTKLAVTSACLISLTIPTPARACSPAEPRPPSALPGPGANSVSTATSIVVLSPLEPFGLSVKVSGQSVPVNGWSALGGGIDQQGRWTQYWRLRSDSSGSMLAPESEYVVSLPAGEDVTELTRFTTAGGYDKTPGTAPILHDLHLWRVRYPVEAIGAGGCVFAEYEGFITFDYDPATIPNTAPASVVQRFALSPKTGGASQTFVYTGETPFKGVAPVGDYLPNSLPTWRPELDPTREYCLTIEAFGDGDLARSAAAGNQLCAQVTELAAPGASLNTTPGGAAPDGGGCAAGGARPGPAAPLVVIPLFWLFAGRARSCSRAASFTNRRTGRPTCRAKAA